jgi:nucleoside-diphosphate-sugar epimerase
LSSKRKKVLVTGACGFIGSHLTNYLQNKGHNVIATDIKPQVQCYLRLRTEHFYQGDLRDRTTIDDIFTKTGKEIDYVYHLAADMGGIGYIMQVRADIMQNSTRINLNMLDACRRYGVKRIFYSSSACVYPEEKQLNPDVYPLKESDAIPAHPDTYYGWEKLYMEYMLAAYNEDYGLEPRIARLHNVFGPYGAYHGKKEKAPAALCRKIAIAKDGEAIIVWGDGKQTRSFCYIDDILRGIDLLMESDYAKPLNLGSDRLVTIDELAKILIEISGKTLTIKHDLSKPQGVRGRNAELTLVKKIIQWEPKIPLETGLKKTYLWIVSMVT